MNTSITNYVGLDLGDNHSLLHICDANGNLLEETRLPTTVAAMTQKFEDQPLTRIAMEVGSQSRWVSQLLQNLGHDVIVANAGKLRLIYENPRKSDRVDAEYLAKLGRLDVSLLAPIQHRGMEAQHDLTLLRSRDCLVQTRTKLINHVRGTLKCFGVRVPSCATRNFAQHAETVLPSALETALTPILEVIQDLTNQIRSFDQQLETLCAEKYPETTCLRQIKGVGALTALAYVLTLLRSGTAAQSIG